MGKAEKCLEDEFWTALKEIAGDRHVTLSELFSGIDKQRQNGNLSSALRLFVLEYYRGKAAEKPGDEMLGQQSPPSAPVLRKRDLRYLFLLRQCLAADGERGHLRPCSRLALSRRRSGRTD
jgi:predicted DNA-binding ribbon-helix-helix protein